MAKKAEEKLTFEQSMEKLEKIVEKLESGSIPLADMVALYEEGAVAFKECSDMLDGYEARLSLLEKGGEDE